MKRGVFVFFACLLTGQLLATSPYEPRFSDILNRRKKFPLGINAYAVGPVGFFAVTADYFATPKLAFELGGGIRNEDFDNGFTLGARYHVLGKTTLGLTPYVGIYTAFHYNGNDLQNYGLYIPVGIHKIKKNGFSWSAEFAWKRNVFTGNNMSFGVRVGYRFKNKSLRSKP